MPRPRRTSTFRLLRALWRYRGRIEAHGEQYQAEVATAVRTALDARVAGRTAITGYRLAMRLLLIGCIALVVVSVLLALALYQVRHGLALLAILPLLLGGLLGWWRLTWGAPLDWLDEHADPDREVPIRELPARLRTLAGETRGLANVPARLGDELDELAGVVADERDSA